MKVAKPSTGRPRTAAIDARLFEAFEELVAEMPIRDFGVQALVARAGTSRDAFYRRYSSIGHFFVDAALRRYVTDPTQDTGSLAGDLLVIQREQVAMYTDPLALGLLTLILNACMDDPVTADSFSTRFLHPRREATVRVLERAVARDEIPPVDDMEYVLDHVSGSFLLRGSMPGTDPIDEAFARRTIVSVLRDLGVPDPLAAVEEAARTLQDDDPHAKERHP